MAELVLMCGPAGSGKTTLARALEARGWRRFSIDEDLWRRGSASGENAPAETVREIRQQHRVRIGVELAAGHDVVVDYAFATRANRDAYRALAEAHGAIATVVHLRVPDAVLRRRLAARRGAHANDVVVPEDVLTRYLAAFEVPGEDEPDVVHVEQ